MKIGPMTAKEVALGEIRLNPFLLRNVALDVGINVSKDLQQCRFSLILKKQQVEKAGEAITIRGDCAVEAKR